MKKYLIRDLITGEYLNDDSYEWGDINNASLFEKIEEKYYSPSGGEQLLPPNSEWELFDIL
jgi:hypothetical protein